MLGTGRQPKPRYWYQIRNRGSWIGTQCQKKDLSNNKLCSCKTVSLDVFQTTDQPVILVNNKNVLPTSQQEDKPEEYSKATTANRKQKISHKNAVKRFSQPASNRSRHLDPVPGRMWFYWPRVNQHLGKSVRSCLCMAVESIDESSDCTSSTNSVAFGTQWLIWVLTVCCHKMDLLASSE